MVSFPSAKSESGGSETSIEPGPNFCPRNGPPKEHIVWVQSNEVHLIPLGNRKCYHKIEITAQDTLDSASSAGKRLTDDLIIFSSRSGVIFGRIPNSLSDDELVQWLKSFLEYVSTSEQAAWWHTDYSGPWACRVFAPMNAKRTNCIYSNTRNDKKRPWIIADIIDAYAQNKPWLSGWGNVESLVAEINGIYYVPRQHKRRRNVQEHSEKSKPTRVSFIWDPVEQSREAILRDEEWKDELLVEQFRMSLI